MIPALDSVFKVQTLSFTQLLIMYGLAVANLPVIQLIKWIRMKIRNKQCFNAPRRPSAGRSLKKGGCVWI